MSATLHGGLLVVHVVCGSLGLALGPVVMMLAKRRGAHTTLGLAYQWTTAGLCATAIALVCFKPSLWGLAAIAVATEATALGGLMVARRRKGNWLPLHLSLTCGSYISFVTAFLVVNLGLSFWPAWILPTIIGSPLIARAARRHPTSPSLAHPGPAHPGPANPSLANPGPAHPGPANPSLANPGPAHLVPGQPHANESRATRSASGSATGARQV